MREAPRFNLTLAPHGVRRVRGSSRAGVLDWLTGLAAVWLLWRPAASAFFKQARALRSGPLTPISGP
jgi:hypothetical protein